MGISVSERNCKWDVFSQLYRTRARERACSAPARTEPRVARARVWTTRAEQRRARVEQLCVGVEQRWQGLRSVTPSPHAAGAQRLTQLRVGPRVPQRDGGWRCAATSTFMLPVRLRAIFGSGAAEPVPVPVQVPEEDAGLLPRPTTKKKIRTWVQ